MAQKRTLDTFFLARLPKKARRSSLTEEQSSGPTNTDESCINEIVSPFSSHPNYPHPIAQLPSSIIAALAEVPAVDAKAINHLPNLDLLYFQPFIPTLITRDLFEFLRVELPFYRVSYNIKRGSIDTRINTPRYTTVFGVDATSFFAPDGSLRDSRTKAAVQSDRYRTCKPRPLPECLDHLRRLTEVFTGEADWNICLVNYYATGADSISYHSDDERFLGPDPAIASFSLGAKRDFLMRHKPDNKDGIGSSKTSGRESSQKANSNVTLDLKLPLGSGDMVLMRGKTQSNWQHSIPKRKGGEADQGRINITLRKALVRGGTENYYQYNVGNSDVWRWNSADKKMAVWGKP